MGTTWGDLRTWSQLDLWWIPNAVQGASTLTASATSAAGGNTVAGLAPALVAVESFAAASRIAVAAGGNVVDCGATASAAVVSSRTASAAGSVTSSATAAAVRIPPADRPAGALVGRIASRS